MKWYADSVTSRCVLCLTSALMFAAALNPLHSQVWERKYGDSKSDEHGYGVTPIKNASAGAGGFVEVGCALVGADNDVYIVKVDNNGTTLWQKTYDFGGGSEDVPLSIFECANGDLLVAGTSEDISPSASCNPFRTHNIFLMRLDDVGNLKSARTFGGRQDEGIVDIPNNIVTNLRIIETSVDNPGDIVIATSTESFGMGRTTANPAFAFNPLALNRDGLLIRTDASCNLKWARAYGSSAPGCAGCLPVITEEYFTSVTEAMNGDLIAAGVTNPTGTQELPWLVRTDPVGTPIWTSAYKIVDANQNVLNTKIYSVRECPSAQNYQNILMAGSCELIEPGMVKNVEMYMLATTNGGLPLANITCGDFLTGTTGVDEARDVIETSAARYVAVGTTTNLGFPGRGSAVYAVQVNKGVNPFTPPLDIMTPLWSRTYGDAWDDQGWSISEVDNSGTFGTPGLLLGGSSNTSSFGRNDWQMYLLKVFGTNGATQCSSVPNDVFTMPTMIPLNNVYETCKVWVQGNRVPSVYVQNWEIEPICEN